MSEFIIRTVDNTYTYTSLIPVGIKFEQSVNIKTADTQGYLRKVNKGKIRNIAEVTIPGLSKTDYENTFLPMLEYIDDVEVTFDRYIPLRGTATGIFTFENMELVQEFSGDLYEIKLTLVEILTL